MRTTVALLVGLMLAVCGVALFLFLMLSGCGKDVCIEFRLAGEEAGEGLTEFVLQESGRAFYVHDEVVLSNADVAAAKVSGWQGERVVELTLTEGGRRTFAEVTTDHVKERMGILVDGRLVSAPVINAPILGGRAIIAGNFTEQEAERIAETLNRR